MLICKDCFLDEELQSEVTSNANAEGRCEVCGNHGRLIDFLEFHPFFYELLSLFELSAQSEKTIVDVIQDDWRIFKNRDIAHILLNEIISTYALAFSINAYVDYNLYIQERIAIWGRLKKSVKEDCRFFTNMDVFTQYNYLTPGKSLPIGHKLYRSRITPAGQNKIKCKNMGCPPKELATAGRANPIGIPYLYLSDTAKTTYFEVRALYLDRLSVGTFKTTRELKLVDFIYDVNLFLAYNDGEVSLAETIIKKKIIDAISADLSKPLRRYDSELEYVPTQLICEYCRHIVNADGITFESSLYTGGRNYVLFDENSAQCMRVDLHEITTIDIDE